MCAAKRRGITKTDFMRGLQCTRMLWLDKHHPEYKVIPAHIRRRLDQGNEFGDAMMGLFGPYVEVREYCQNTERPNITRMAAKTAELMAEGTPVICEAAFLDADGNYCAVDILRSTPEGYEIYEVKNTPCVKDNLIEDAAYQAFLMKEQGVTICKVSIVYHPEGEAYAIEDVTEQAFSLAEMILKKRPELMAVKAQEEEECVPMGMQCTSPYECWYIGYCSMAEAGTLNRCRCGWVDLRNHLMVAYHDNEWGKPCHDDGKLFEMLLLEMFQAGLSWECILNKRENFRLAFDGFDVHAVATFDDARLDALMEDAGIVRNRLKLRAAVRNAGVFLKIQEEFGSFDAYLWDFTDGHTLVISDGSVTSNELSDRISKDLKKRGMDFCGSVIIYAYLQAIGIIDSHGMDCFLYAGE